MAKKKNKKDAVRPPEGQGKSTADYYKLKTDAVDRLVNASAETAPEVTEKDIRKVSGKRKFNIPFPVKALFIKFWFAGAVCFFFYFGLGGYLQVADLLFVFGAALGAVKNLLENNMLRFIERDEGESKRFMLVETKKFWGLFLDVLYGFVILGVVMYIYSLITVVLAATIGSEKAAGFGVEPLLFGFVATVVDMAFVSVKNLIRKIISDAKKSVLTQTDRKQ
ncbi:MAG: hypothetical protein J6U10_09225 [Lachnospiraceae bacterium]|nr:hypothetical protein [Lachnospiraceae bacterium]